ncbi:MAG: hypothetical protein JHD35_01075 [Sphingopyxis sp.]|nr:hypothetical protein [Sphingopyxis sp.]
MARNPVLSSIRKLAGYQAISLNEAFRLLIAGRGDPDLMPMRARKGLCSILRGFGYRETFMIKSGSDEGQLMWVRDPWPVDVDVIRCGKTETYERF